MAKKVQKSKVKNTSRKLSSKYSMRQIVLLLSLGILIGILLIFGLNSKDKLNLSASASMYSECVTEFDKIAQKMKISNTYPDKIKACKDGAVVSSGVGTSTDYNYKCSNQYYRDADREIWYYAEKTCEERGLTKKVCAARRQEYQNAKRQCDQCNSLQNEYDNGIAIINSDLKTFYDKYGTSCIAYTEKEPLPTEIEVSPTGEPDVKSSINCISNNDCLKKLGNGYKCQKESRDKEGVCYKTEITPTVAQAQGYDCRVSGCASYSYCPSSGGECIKTCYHKDLQGYCSNACGAGYKEYSDTRYNRCPNNSVGAVCCVPQVKAPTGTGYKRDLNSTPIPRPESCKGIPKPGDELFEQAKKMSRCGVNGYRDCSKQWDSEKGVCYLKCSNVCAE